MTTPSPLDPLAERIEQLLQQFASSQALNQQLEAQLQATTRERDLLQSRLKAARARIDALIERLPQNQGQK